MSVEIKASPRGGPTNVEPGGGGGGGLNLEAPTAIIVAAAVSETELETNPDTSQANSSKANNSNSRKRKRNNLANQKSKRQKGFNNNNPNKRQKNKQQNIIICGMPGSTSLGALNNNVSIANPKANQENNFPNQAAFRKNFNKLNFKHLNNNNSGRSRRLHLFPPLSKYFLPDKRPPRKEVIIPPTKFLLGGNISDPLNLNSLQDEAIQATLNAATPKSSPMTTPPKVEVIIPPNIHDPLHLLDTIDTIEYEKQLTSPMKKLAGNKLNKNRHNRNKKKAKDKEVANPKPENETATDKAPEEGSSVVRPTELKLEEEKTGENHLPSMEKGGRKRKISETSSIQNKLRRMDSIDKIVSPVIPQPGARKRHIVCGPQGGPHRNSRQRTQSVQSLEEEPVAATKTTTPTEEVKPIVAPEITKESGAQVDGGDDKNIKGEVIEKVQPMTDKKKNKAKKKSVKFQYGNYDRYYGYRNLNEDMDVRLKVFLQNPFLFRDKDILDIGCNVGQMTIEVAKLLAPKSILGIDIDSKLIHKAKRNVSLYVRVPKEEPKAQPGTSSTTEGTLQKKNTHQINNNSQKRNKKAKSSANHHQFQQFEPFFPKSFPMCYGVIPDLVKEQQPQKQPKKEDEVAETEQEKKPNAKAVVSTITSSSRALFPKNVKFQTANYVLKDEKLLATDQQQKFDLILCLSVTKWIHLNFGDAGLKMMFRRIFNQLRPGGKLILEAQNWASYNKKKKLTETIFNNYKSIEFYPNKFHEYLLSPEVGFSHSYPLGIPRHLSKGFRRPIQLYIKGDFTPSQVMWSDAYHPQTPYTPYRGIYAEVMCPPARFSVWGPENTPFRSTYGMSTSQYYNPLETDSYLPSYETEVVNRRYCFQSPLYSAAWSPPPNSETRTPPKVSIMTPPASMTPSSTHFASTSVTNTPNHNHVYPPDDDILLNGGVAPLENGNSSSPHNNADDSISPEH